MEDRRYPVFWKREELNLVLSVRAKQEVAVSKAETYCAILLIYK